jgi:hypothetical protein
MSSSFFSRKIFDYDLEGKRLSNDNKEEIPPLRPKSEESILGDIDRDLRAGNIIINGQNALNLRMKDKKLTTIQCELCKLNIDSSPDDIDKMNFAQMTTLMKKHQKETLEEKDKSTIEKILEAKSEAEMRILIREYHDELMNKRIGFSSSHGHTTFEELIEFLDKHLLNNIKADKTPAGDEIFLATTIAKNLHQENLLAAATNYYQGFQAPTILGGNTFKLQNGDQIITLEQPKRTIRLNYTKRVISVKEDSIFTGVTTDSAIKDQEVYNHEGDPYMARVQLGIRISAQKNKDGTYTANVKKDHLLVDLKKDKDPAINKLFSKIFKDTRTAAQKILDWIIEKITGQKKNLLQESPPSRSRIR